MEKEFRGKTILVTGGTGTIGSELVRQILKFKPKQVRVLSRDETKQYQLQESLNNPKNVRFLIGDIRDRDRLDLALKGVDIVFHAAAMKHIVHCEYNPQEAVKTNIIGSQNIIELSIMNGIKKVIGISTDKAVNPTNVLGTTKLMMEKLFTNANYVYGQTNTIFSCVRFGNITWSSGSVLPIWRNQVENSGKIKITDDRMTRFFISKEEAIKLVLRATTLSQGGEVFILKMPSIKLLDLAKIFIRKYYPQDKIKVENIGNRGQEKEHEELFDKQDLYNHIFADKEIFVIVPELKLPKPVSNHRNYRGFKELNKISDYTSLDALNVEQIARII